MQAPGGGGGYDKAPSLTGWRHGGGGRQGQDQSAQGKCYSGLLHHRKEGEAQEVLRTGCFGSFFPKSSTARARIIPYEFVVLVSSCRVFNVALGTRVAMLADSPSGSDRGAVIAVYR